MHGWKHGLRTLGVVVLVSVVAAVVPRFVSGLSSGATSPPLMGAVSDQPSRNASTIVWSTSVPSTGQVSFGPTVQYGRSAADPVMRRVHTVTLTGLACNTEYHFRVRSTNAAGSRSSNDLVTRTPSCTRAFPAYRHLVINDRPACHVLERGIADIDGDGRADAVIGWGTACGTGGIFWYRQPAGEITRKWVAYPIVPAGLAYEDLLPSDVNGDGAVDVIAAVNDEIHWYENPRGRGADPATATWVDHVIGDVAFGPGGTEPPEAHDMALADVDGDSRIDVVTNAFVFFQDDVDRWTRVPYNRTGQGAGVFDSGSGNGAIDLVGISTAYPYNLVWLENPRNHGGNARTDAWIEHEFAPGYDNQATGVSFGLGDVNGDGRMDIATAQAERRPDDTIPPGGVIWWEAPADRVSGPWIKHVVDGTFRDVHKLRVADMDGNGSLDIVAAEQDQSAKRRVAVFHNDGNGTFVQQVLGNGAGHNEVVGDVDGDGRPDVLSAAHGFFGGPVRIEIWLAR